MFLTEAYGMQFVFLQTCSFMSFVLRDFGIDGLKGSATWPFAEAVIAHGTAKSRCDQGWLQDGGWTSASKRSNYVQTVLDVTHSMNPRIVPPTESLQLAAASLHL